MNRGQGVKGSRGHVHSLALFLTLLLLVFLTRFPFRTKILYDWDSVQFALGMRHFDVSLFQPHPPGYFFYVASARAVNFFVHDENTSLVLLSILGSAVALYFTFLLGLRMFSKEVAVAATALLFTSPLFWMFGLIGNPDIFDAAFSAWFAYLAWRVLKGEAHLLPWASLLLGIASGFRTGLLIFLGPMWIYVILFAGFKSKSVIVSLFKNILIVSVCIAVYLIPTALHSGGFNQYADSFSRVSGSFLETSVLQKGVKAVLGNSRTLLSYVFLSSWGLGTLIFIFYIPAKVFEFLMRKKRPADGSNIEFYILRNNNAFFALWVLPAALFIAFIHAETSAFCIVLLPFLFILAAVVFHDFSNIHYRLLFPFLRKELIFAVPLFILIAFQLWLPVRLSLTIVRMNNRTWIKSQQAIEKNFKPENTLLVTTAALFEGMQTAKAQYLFQQFYFFRHSMYYLSRYNVFFLPQIGSPLSRKQPMLVKNMTYTFIAVKSLADGGFFVPMPEGIKHVVFMDPFIATDYISSSTRGNKRRRRLWKFIKPYLWYVDITHQKAIYYKRRDKYRNFIEIM